MSQTETLYTTLNAELFAQLSEIKLLVCDVDGVFSDGRIYLGNDAFLVPKVFRSLFMEQMRASPAK